VQFKKSGLTAIFDSVQVPHKHLLIIPNSDVLKTYIALLCMGYTEFDSIKLLAADEDAACRILHLQSKLPCESALRLRMDAIGAKLHPLIEQHLPSFFRSIGDEFNADEMGFITVDLDVTPFDNSNSQKEGVSYTYKGFDGFSPMIAYSGEMMVNQEFRAGEQHCQKNTPDFLRRTIKIMKETVGNSSNLLIRMDSGNDSVENIAVCREKNGDYVIKRNLRRESREDWLKAAKADEKLDPQSVQVLHPREGKTVYVGSRTREIVVGKDANGNEIHAAIRQVYEITERTMDKYGQVLLMPEIDVNAWYTSLSVEQATDSEIIRYYHDHAICEQYHSELKTDMDVERLPSGKFATNALVMSLTLIAFNLLRRIGQESIKGYEPIRPNKEKPVTRRRLKTVIQHLIYIAVRFVRHGRVTKLRIGRSNPLGEPFLRIAGAFG
jgi:hypothetical protein